jgi:NTE family protein
MKTKLPFLILFVFVIFSQLAFAQNKKPKVAVVLSGGGAKGIAHIPLLQALDSLGIVPDLIIGTSMGSIIGGFYAMGYSGDSIETITKNANWNELLGGKTALKNVSVEEKSEFDKYLVEFDFIKGKPKLSSSLVNDQNLREYLALYAYPVFNIHDFDSLPIPYRAMTTDIVNGKEVLLEEGSLVMAMRASMSIPSIFKPVDYNDALLVDGGILNNFPTDVAKKMGADIIIGSDVGGGTAPKEELEGIISILFQSAMLTSNIKNPASRELCDILIDHLPNLTYSTGDFNNSNEIYEEGKIGTSQKIDELVVLAKQLKGFKQRDSKQPSTNKKFVLDTVVYKGVSEEHINLVKSRANISSNEAYEVQDIIEGVNRAMGTTLFNQIMAGPIKHNDKLGVEIEGFEKTKNIVKASLHYDTYRSIGLILNYTGRNILGNSSRLLFTADIAEQPRFRLQYQKYLGQKNSWWWRSEALAEFLNNKVFLKGNFAEDMYFRYFQFDNQINKNINSLSSYVGFGLNFENTFISPKADPEISENVLLLKNYNFNYFEAHVHYSYNKLTTAFYAEKGSFFKVKLGRSLYQDVDLEFSDEPQTTIKGSTNGFTRLTVAYEKRILIKKKITGIVRATSGFIFEDNLKSNDISFTDYGYAAKYFLGGNLSPPRGGSYAFSGLHEGELNVNQFMKFNLGVQFNPINKIYVTPHLNYASVGFTNFNEYIKDTFFPKGNWTDQLETSSLFSAGATASYNSYLGPINLDVSWVNDINKFRIFFSVGMHFNLSN